MSEDKKYFQQKDTSGASSPMTLADFTEAQKGKPRGAIITFAHEATERITELIGKIELWRFRTGVYRKVLRDLLFTEGGFTHRGSTGDDELILSCAVRAIVQGDKAPRLERENKELKSTNAALRAALAEMEMHLLNSNRAMRAVAPLLAGGASVVSDATLSAVAGAKAGGFRGQMHTDEEQA